MTGVPIVLIVTGPSNNVKTGPMCQAWVLLRDVEPFEAVRVGADRAICGTCVHREGGRRTCYVSLFNGPTQIWRRLQGHGYPSLTGASAAAALAGQWLRVAAYGDPAFIPLEVWTALLSRVRGWTGYTHQWRTCDPRFQTICMASVETETEADLAHARGWRTFRARPAGSPLARWEFACPASDEAGHRTTCQQCQLCRGLSSPAKSVSIHLHGRAITGRRGPRRLYDELRTEIASGGGQMRLTLSERDRVVLALRQYYRRRREDIRLRTERLEDEADDGRGLYRFWRETMASTRRDAVAPEDAR